MQRRMSWDVSEEAEVTLDRAEVILASLSLFHPSYPTKHTFNHPNACPPTCFTYWCNGGTDIRLHFSIGS